jgi:hypothetical protein
LYIKGVEEQNEPGLKYASLKEWLTGCCPQYFPVKYYYTQLQEKRQEDGESLSQSLVQIKAITTKTTRKSVATKLLLQGWQQITITWKTDIITISAVSLVMKLYTT